VDTFNSIVNFLLKNPTRNAILVAAAAAVLSCIAYLFRIPKARQKNSTVAAILTETRHSPYTRLAELLGGCASLIILAYLLMRTEKMPPIFWIGIVILGAFAIYGSWRIMDWAAKQDRRDS
jgi:hypothetical protein